MKCTPNPGQKQERGIFHEIHNRIQARMCQKV
jgi:hypothetical protein